MELFNIDFLEKLKISRFFHIKHQTYLWKFFKKKHYITFQVLDEYYPDYKLSVETYCALTLVPLVLICQIRNLKWLVPFSALANVFLVICFSITMYYIFNDMPNPSEREMVASVSQWPLFIR